MKILRIIGLVMALAALGVPGWPVAAHAAAPVSVPAATWLSQVQGFDEIIFCARLPYDDPHWYANIGYYCDNEQQKAWAGNGKPDLGRLYKLNVRTGVKQLLVDEPGSSVRDPCVDYDGRKVLFSWRRNGEEYYHLYEVGLDGAGLRQVTSGPFDDYEAAYLPDGDLIFVSTRCNRWVNCWKTQVGVMYRCDAQGDNIQLVSANTEHDNTPWVLPDGRILYTRWEYVDRSQVEYHALWTMNPDGTSHAVYYGNQHPHTVMIDAKPVPGTRLVMANFSPGHGVTDHAGFATLVNVVNGPDHQPSAVIWHKERLIRDPYPLSTSLILAARDNQIILMNDRGEPQILFTLEGPGGLHEPRPAQSRPREPILQSRHKADHPSGTMVLANVYQGRNIAGVKRGDIKKLLLLESLPKPVNFSGGPDLVSWLGTFTLERVLGTVPVEEDGSACFEVPANRQVFFVALDENDLAVKRMQSFASVAPGETLSCVGCHEDRRNAPDHQSHSLYALRRAPSAIQPFEGYPDVLDFRRDIQPVLDRLCVDCHTYTNRQGQVILAGDLGPEWSHAYYSLLAHEQVADGHNGHGNKPPRSLGSAASPLLRKLEGGHHGVKAVERDWRTVWLWLESGAPYAGSYAALRNEEAQHRAGQAASQPFAQAASVFTKRCVSCHDRGGGYNARRPLPMELEMAFENPRRVPGRTYGSYERVVLTNDPIARLGRHILLNYTRPEYSPLLLGPLAKTAGGYGSCGEVFATRDDPDCQALLGAIRQAQAVLNAAPPYGDPHFRPNRQYIREMKKYGVLPGDFDPDQEEIDVFALDRKYWESFWYSPAVPASPPIRRPMIRPF